MSRDQFNWREALAEGLEDLENRDYDEFGSVLEELGLGSWEEDLLVDEFFDIEFDLLRGCGLLWSIGKETKHQCRECSADADSVFDLIHFHEFIGSDQYNLVCPCCGKRKFLAPDGTIHNMRAHWEIYRDYPYSEW